MKQLATVILICSLAITSCKQQSQLEYLYADKEQAINCAGDDSALLNEALHSFEEALFVKYEPENRNLTMAYGRFVYRGFNGTGEYKALLNDHIWEIRDALLDANILITNGTYSNLNYEHPAVQCVLDKIKDTKLKKTINSLIATSGMNPKLLDSRMRNVGRQVTNDRHIAMYTALDAFYQHIATLPQPVATE